MENQIRKYVSDYISDNEINRWNAGDVVAISAGCGSGKSHFIKNILYEKAKSQNKKILMLIHRTNCVEQFKIEIENNGKSDVISIKTYQSIERTIISKGEYLYDDYAYLVCDEFHYFIEDSNFNCYTDISFDSIINCKGAVKIFMSATGEAMQDIIQSRCHKKSKLHSYRVPMDFDHIKELVFYYKNDTTEALAHKFKKSNDKAIFFIQSASEAHTLYRKFSDCSTFLCGKGSEQYYKDVNETVISNMLTNERFEKQFLICTTCFDAGANIIDPDLHTVVIDVKNVSTLIQCLGRKRSRASDDYLNVYIKAIPNRRINGMSSMRKTALKKADYLIKNDTQAFLKEYPRDERIDKFNTALIYDEPLSQKRKNSCTKRVNMMIYEKFKADISEYAEMMQIGYVKYIARLLHFGYGFNRYYRMHEEGELTEYLQMLADEKTVMLTADDRIQLIEKMDVKHNRKLIKSEKILNDVLEEKDYPFRIESFETSRIVDGKKKKYKHAWRVITVT